MDKQAQFSGTAEVRSQHRFDEQKLLVWMQKHVEDFSGPLRVEQFKGGQSNPTYKLFTPQKNYVLRRKPPGQLLKSAHAVDREYRVISALHGVDFPVARTYGLCTDESLIGTWFYVMDCVDGRIIWDTSFPDVSKAERAAYFDAMNSVMAQLHTIDYAKIGLADYSKTGNYFERQIGRWSKQYLADEAAGRVADMDKLVQWLPANIPPGDETTIVHGDYRCDNMIFHPTEPRVLAVLDWELSTLGHPLGDFTYHLMMYRMPPGVTAGLVGTNLGGMGIPSEAEYVQNYCARTGRSGIENLDFYLAFNMFRLAAILHGIRGRVARGTAASEHAKTMASFVEPLAAMAWKQIKSEPG